MRDAPVLTQRHGACWRVTLNRPAVRNCVDRPTAAADRKSVV